MPPKEGMPKKHLGNVAGKVRGAPRFQIEGETHTRIEFYYDSQFESERRLMLF